MRIFEKKKKLCFRKELFKLEKQNKKKTTSKIFPIF